MHSSSWLERYIYMNNTTLLDCDLDSTVHALDIPVPHWSDTGNSITLLWNFFQHRIGVRYSCALDCNSCSLAYCLLYVQLYYIRHSWDLKLHSSHFSFQETPCLLPVSQFYRKIRRNARFCGLVKCCETHIVQLLQYIFFLFGYNCFHWDSLENALPYM